MLHFLAGISTSFAINLFSSFLSKEMADTQNLHLYVLTVPVLKLYSSMFKQGLVVNIMIYGRSGSEVVKFRRTIHFPQTIHMYQQRYSQYWRKSLIFAIIGDISQSVIILLLEKTLRCIVE